MVFRIRHSREVIGNITANGVIQMTLQVITVNDGASRKGRFHQVRTNVNRGRTEKPGNVELGQSC